MLPDPRANANLLLVEVGNSHVSVACSRDGRLGDALRVENDQPPALPDRLEAAWAALPTQRLRVLVVASVVPARTAALRELCTARFESEAVVLGDDVPVPIDVRIDSPKSVGVDRLLGAAAAYAEIQSACVIASFGTATTVDCVNADGEFMGGAILPGLATQSWSLRERTAQLPEVAIAVPERVYGGSTDEAIRNGIVYGAAGALREIVERYATDLGSWPRLILTGGFAPLMRQTCDFVDAVVPDLVLRGMEQAYRAFYRDESE